MGEGGAGRNAQIVVAVMKRRERGLPGGPELRGRKEERRGRVSQENETLVEGKREKTWYLPCTCVFMFTHVSI